MASLRKPWTVCEYTIPASYPRGFRRGVRDPQTSRLKLSVKQYIPQPTSTASDRSADNNGGVTLILHHGMAPAAFKESWEPFLSDLLESPGLPPIRAVWAYDVVAFGQSYLLNQDELGDLQHWHDSARDLLQMVNYFQDQIRPPLVGFGQSWGVVSIIMAASWSPRLFYGIILAEPVVENGYIHQREYKARGMSDEEIYAANTGRRFVHRKTRWKSMHEARDYLSKSSSFRPYDPRVLELIFKHELVQHDDGSVEIIPPNPLVVSYFLRPMPPLPGVVPNPEDHTIEDSALTLPGFGNNQSPQTMTAMKSVSCKVLYLWASDAAFISSPSYRERVLRATGTGPGGGGGRTTNQIVEVTVDGGHSLPYFQPSRTATAVGTWLRDTFWKAWADELEAVKKEPPIKPSEFSRDFIARLERGVSKL